MQIFGRFLFAVLLMTVTSVGMAQQIKHSSTKFYPATDNRIQYVGRFDWSIPQQPRFWSPGAYIRIRFKGTKCVVKLHDQELWGKNHNYIGVLLDNKKVTRLQTSGKVNEIVLADSLKNAIHTLVLCKNTESNIGFLALEGFVCDSLLAPDPLPARKIELIGNSITCTAGSDQSLVPCGKGEWHDQHNALMGYGPLTARALNAQWVLSAVSGIGLMHSCCNLPILMPQVFDKIDLRGDSIAWDFNKYQPDIVTVCLGQNDGVQDSASFVKQYVAFVGQLRKHYPQAKLLLLSSPMADQNLRNFLRRSLKAVLQSANETGEKNIAIYIFEKSYNAGCDYHPSLEEHREIAKLLTAKIRQVMHWK